MTTFADRFLKDITPERYKILRGRYEQFAINLDKDAPVIKVHDALRQDQLDQLAVIREVSQDLQRLKEEDILKAKQAAEEASKAAEEEKKKSEEKAEDNEGEENTEETEKKDEK